MTEDELELYITKLTNKGELWRFYKSEAWLKLRSEVMEDNNYECQDCREDITKGQGPWRTLVR